MKRSLLAPLVASALLSGCGGSSGGHATAATVPTYESLAGGDPSAISADGTLVVGTQEINGYGNPVVWKGAAASGALPFTESSFNYAQAVSIDGSTVLGIKRRDDGSFRALLYSPLGGYVAVPMPNGATQSYGVAMSGDAKVVACDDAPPTNPYSPKPFVVRDGIAAYLPLPSGATTGTVGAVSSDGSTVVGTAGGKPVRWVGDGAPEALSDGDGEALAVNGDGTVVVGLLFDSTAGWKPFRWTAGSGVQDLPTVANFRYGQANGVSADGKTVLLNAEDPAQRDLDFVYLWREGVGTTPVADLFAAAGGKTAFAGSDAVALSANGKVIVGRGTHSSSGDLVGSWKLTLP